MSRTRAQALVLVNWKGVFYERYLIDRHVTAFEGDNGAGKTTVMIAAYVVLLPDMSRLRFTNLGETGATGGDKGIWGRLGELGRPAYSAIDFALTSNHRLVAGVHLERKGEPSVEPTPFIISGLDADVRLQDVLLLSQGDHEVVSELNELRENAARLGGHMQVFGTARDYFAALFDQGVTPLRLGTEEERNKLNEMLRTSMTGGISCALTSELRSFLLKEESGLADTLQRMKANLDACRRTRTEVQESQRLEREIGGVLEAGETMFAAAFLATRERADELSRRVEEAESVRACAVEVQASARDALSRTLSDLVALERRRGELGQVIESVSAWQNKLHEALAAAGALAACGERLKHVGDEAQEATRERDEADNARARAREGLRRAQEGYKRAAAGLADVQRGIEELHRRAGAYHQAVRRLHEAEKCLGGAPLNAPEFDERLAAARAELAVVDDERRDAATRLADAETHRKEHAVVMQALSALVEEDVAIEQAHEVARGALKHHRDLVALAARLPVIERDLAEARRLEARQSKARERAQALCVVLAERSGAEVVRQLLDEVEGACRNHQERSVAAESDAAAKERELKELDARRRYLTASEPEWREHAERAAGIAQYLEMVVDSRASLDVARAELGQRLASIRRAESDARDTQERLLREARELVAAGGQFPLELLKLKEQLGAELVAGSFDDVGLDEAARVEARLGGLAQALVVDDPKAAARMLATRPDALPEVLLVARNTDLEQLAAAEDVAPVGDDDVAVEERAALRISRIPSDPQLGRRAHEQRAADLRREADVKAHELDELRSLGRRLERLVLDGEALLAGHATKGAEENMLREALRSVPDARPAAAHRRARCCQSGR